MTATPATTGLLRFGHSSHPSMRLFGFPYAGGGASVFRRWPAMLPASVELLAIQLPGTESRVRETPLEAITDMVAQLAPLIVARSELPFAFFGHSLGAVLAFEVTRALRRAGARMPMALMVSGRRGPRIPDRHAPLRHFPDHEFVRQIDARYGGIRHEVFQHPDLMALLLPGLRASITALETHQFEDEPPLSCPLVALGGASDPMAPEADIDAWREETLGPFTSRTFPGDHFYLLHHPDPVIAEVVATLRAYAPSPGLPAT